MFIQQEAVWRWLGKAWPVLDSDLQARAHYATGVRYVKRTENKFKEHKNMMLYISSVLRKSTAIL